LSYRRMQAILQKIYAKDFYIHKSITSNITHKLHYVRYSTRRLTTGYVMRDASLGNFVVVRTCTYTNLDSTA